MTRRTDYDALLLLAREMGWSASEKLKDQIEDPELLAQLRELEAWRSILNHEVEPRSGFTEEVMEALGPGRTQERRESLVALTVHGSLATLGCFTGLLVVFDGGFLIGPGWILFGTVSAAFGIGSARNAWRDSPV